MLWCWKYPKFRLSHKNQTLFRPLLTSKSEFRLLPKIRTRVGGLYWGLHGGFCHGGFCHRGFCHSQFLGLMKFGGILSQVNFSLGDFVKGDFVTGGFCHGGFCRRSHFFLFSAFLALLSNQKLWRLQSYSYLSRIYTHVVHMILQNIQTWFPHN